MDTKTTKTTKTTKITEPTETVKTIKTTDIYENLNRILDQDSGYIDIDTIAQLGGDKNKTNKKGSKKKSKKRQVLPPSPIKTSNFSIESTHIVNFFDDSDNDYIKKHLIRQLNIDTFCDKVLGSGFVGLVKTSGIGATHTIHYNDRDTVITVVIPVVIKEARVDSDIEAFTNTATNILYLYCSGGLTMEALILYYIRILINDKKSPHLPLIIGHSKCDQKTLQPIDRIITEYHGWHEDLHIKMKGNSAEPLFHHDPNYDPMYPIYTTKLNTLDDLFVWCTLSKNEDEETVILPNNQKCNVVELLNYLSISYIITYDLLLKHNIHLLDMHIRNVFIHWLSEKSYMHDQFIGDTEYIFYKVGKKYYKIKTFGLILKIGDVGASIVHPRKDLYLVGQGNNLYVTYPIVDSITKNNDSHQFLRQFIHGLSLGTYIKTIAFKIMSSHPYDKLFWLSNSDDLLKSVLSTEELLGFFDQYSVDSISQSDRKNKSNLIIE